MTELDLLISLLCKTKAICQCMIEWELIRAPLLILKSRISNLLLRVKLLNNIYTQFQALNSIWINRNRPSSLNSNSYRTSHLTKCNSNSIIRLLLKDNLNRSQVVSLQETAVHQPLQLQPVNLMWLAITLLLTMN